MTDERNIFHRPVADRVRGPMEIRDRPGGLATSTDAVRVTDEAVTILKRLLDPASEVDGAGYVDITPDDVRIDTCVALSEEEAEYLLRLKGFDDAYIGRYFSR